MNPSILIVDDQVMMTHFLTYYFRKNFEVFVQHNGVEALNWLEGEQLPDVIISDIDIPLLNGIEFLKILKSKESLRNIPVIILSSRTNEDDKEKCFELGASNYLTKPFNPEELALLVNRAIISSRKV